jgi:predicted O-methyltransferase YrrM
VYSVLRLKDRDALRIARWRHGDAPRVDPHKVFPGIETSEVVLLKAFDHLRDTSIDPQELLVLCAIERHVSAANVLEIGTWNGRTALNLAANASDGGRVTTIDLPPDWDGTLRYDVPAEYRNATYRGQLASRYADTPYEGRIRQVFGDSALLDWDELGESFDLIFIDGCHHYDYVKSDTENAYRRLKPGGVLVWHDYGMIRDVSRALDENAVVQPVQVIRGTRLAVARKPDPNENVEQRPQVSGARFARAARFAPRAGSSAGRAADS